MRHFKSPFAFAAILAVIATHSLRTHSSFALAAPVGQPSPPPCTSLAIPNTPACRLCLSVGLKNVDNCGELTEDTPALPADETDPVKIQEYKTLYPKVVDCLCRASNPLPNSSWWVDACDDMCTVAVIKTQKCVLKEFSTQLSCNANTGQAPSPPSMPLSVPAAPNSMPSAEIFPTSQPLPNGTDKAQQAQTQTFPPPSNP